MRRLEPGSLHRLTMAYTLRVVTRGGFLDTPFRCYTDALGEAVKALRNGISFRQMILDSNGDLMKSIEPELPRVKLVPKEVFQSGFVVTPGLSATGCTLGASSAPTGGVGLSLTGETFDLVEGL